MGDGVGLGFPIAVILDILARVEAYQLPPLTVIFSLIIGMLSSFGGVYIGKFLKHMLSEKKVSGNV